jgi:hypothetical protein
MSPSWVVYLCSFCIGEDSLVGALVKIRVSGACRAPVAGLWSGAVGSTEYIQFKRKVTILRKA